MTKRIVSITVVLCMALAVMSLAGCSKSYDGEINIYNFGEYIDEDVYKAFEDEYNIKVNYTTYETCESLYSVLMTGGADYDVVITSDYMIARLAEQGMLAELDFDNIPNYSLIGDSYKNLEYDPEGLYSVPYMWGTVGIIYNGAEIDEDIHSWSTMFDEKYSGQILMFDSTRDAFGVALKALGYSMNTTDETEIRNAYELLEQQKPLLQGYFQDQMYDKLEGGEALIGAYYAGDYICMLDNNPDLKFVVPDEGANFYVDAMCIPATSENQELAEKFINYMCETDVSLANMDATGYASPNTESCAIYSEDLEDWIRDIMFPSDEVISRCEVFLSLPQETLDLYDSLWVELKA
ncbi:MAG: PotD/PotF family extracellular solute-binding protein [Oscillospiraceae bacterium]